MDDLERVARDILADGGGPDHAVRAALSRTSSPIAAIKAVQAATGLGLRDAKRIVHAHLDPDAAEAAEHLWTALIDAVATIATEQIPGPADPAESGEHTDHPRS